jgi:hypothetical protein
MNDHDRPSAEDEEHDEDAATDENVEEIVTDEDDRQDSEAPPILDHMPHLNPTIAGEAKGMP